MFSYYMFIMVSQTWAAFRLDLQIIFDICIYIYIYAGVCVCVCVCVYVCVSVCILHLFFEKDGQSYSR